MQARIEGPNHLPDDAHDCEGDAECVLWADGFTLDDPSEADDEHSLQMPDHSAADRARVCDNVELRHVDEGCAQSALDIETTYGQRREKIVTCSIMHQCGYHG